jgi:hypothetical protein
MQAGAVFSVAGASLGGQNLSFRSNGGLATVNAPGSAGGSIEIRSAKALDLFGSFAGGGGGGSRGGSITIALETSDPAVLDVANSVALSSRSNKVGTLGYARYQAEAGTGAVVADQLNAGNFGDVALRSSDALAFGLAQGDLGLSASASLKLDAPTLLADSGARAAALKSLEQAATRELNSRTASVKQGAVDELKVRDRARGVIDRDYTDLIEGLILMPGDETHHREPAHAPPPQKGEIYDRYRHFTAPMKGLQYTGLSMNLMAQIAEIGRHLGLDLWNYQAPGGETLRLPFEYYSDFYRLQDSGLKHGLYKGETDRIGQAGDSPAAFELGLARYPDSQPLRDLLWVIDRPIHRCHTLGPVLLTHGHVFPVQKVAGAGSDLEF